MGSALSYMDLELARFAWTAVFAVRTEVVTISIVMTRIYSGCP